MSFYQMHRGWMDSEVWDQVPYSEREAWEWMIGEANWKPGLRNILGRPVMLQTGQFSHSVRFMADKFQWSVKKVRCYVEKLTIWGMITTDKGTAQLIITICNYSKYQIVGQAQGQTQGQAKGTGGAQEGHKQEEISNTDQYKNTAFANFSEKEISQFRKQCPSLSDREFANEVHNCNVWINAHGSRTPELTLSKWLQSAEARQPKKGPLASLQAENLAIIQEAMGCN